MKKRLKYARDVTVGDAIKIAGCMFEVSSVETVGDDIVIQMWFWASPRKTCTLRFNDPTFPVTVR